MKQVNFVVECVVNQSAVLFIVRGHNGQIVKYADDICQLADFFDDVCYKNRESEGK